MPYPPNFSKIPAKTIEPEIGASTCAFGSHKCVKNIGIFTKNAAIIPTHKKILKHISKENK